MRSRTTQVLALVGVLIAVAIGVVVASTFAGGKATTSKADYQATVLKARDRTDFALARITKSQSVDELIKRIDEASVVVGSTADQLNNAAVAKGFEGDNARLVTTLRAFSDELAGTASTFSDPTFGNSLASANSLSFPEWDKVNAILTEMRGRGLHVPLLARH
jgi:hypothetical protein